MVIGLFTVECLHKCCIQVYFDLESLALQPGKEDWIRSKKGTDALEARIREIWIEDWGGSASEWPWNKDFIIQAYIKERKKTRKDKDALLVGQRSSGFFSSMNKAGRIYFLENSRGHIKIGWTSGLVEDRVRALQTGESEPLIIKGRMDGSQSQERSIQARFAVYKTGGGTEWFFPNPELIELVERFSIWQ